MTISAALFREIFTDIVTEATSAVAKHGPQSHPNGTGEAWAKVADMARARCDRAAKNGELTWMHILREEFYEALAEEDGDALRAELIQVATMAAMWVLDIDNKAGRQQAPKYTIHIDNPANPPVRPYVPGGGVPAAYSVDRYLPGGKILPGQF